MNKSNPALNRMAAFTALLWNSGAKRAASHWIVTKTAAAWIVRCRMISFQCLIRRGTVTMTRIKNVHWRLLKLSTSYLSSNGIWTITAASRMLDQLLRMALGRGKFLGVCAPERSSIDDRDAKARHDHLGGFNDDTHIRAFCETPHFVEVHFFDQPTDHEPIIETRILTLEQQLVLIS